MEEGFINCGSCGECSWCEKKRQHVDSMKHIIACGDTCKCLCVLERPINSLPEDIDIFAETFRIQCGSSIPKKIIGEIRKMKADLVKERIQYKTEKDKLTVKLTKAEKEITTLKYTMDKLLSQLAVKGIQVKL